MRNVLLNNGYVLIYLPDHPLATNGYVKEHRLVAAQEWGIDAVKDMHVHHKNGDRASNKIENLELLSKSEHSRLHRRSPNSKVRLPGEPNPNVKCKCGCGDEFPRFNKWGKPREYIHSHTMWVKL